MPVTANISHNHSYGILDDVAVRTGILAGVMGSGVFTAWLIIANRAPLLERLALPRNLIAATLMVFLCSIPVLRFLRSPSDLLASGLLTWGIFTLTYRLLCMEFVRLEERFTATHVFVLGAVLYLLLATLSWLGTIIWRVRAARRGS